MHEKIKGASEAPRTHFRAFKISKFSEGMPLDPLTQSLLWSPTFYFSPAPPPNPLRGPACVLAWSDEFLALVRIWKDHRCCCHSFTSIYWQPLHANLIEACSPVKFAEEIWWLNIGIFSLQLTILPSGLLTVHGYDVTSIFFTYVLSG